jgi:hypothetical protein
MLLFRFPILAGIIKHARYSRGKGTRQRVREGRTTLEVGISAAGAKLQVVERRAVIANVVDLEGGVLDAVLAGK